LNDLLQELPAVMLVGPRAVGKTTLASRVARTVVPLDDLVQAAAFRADADAALAAADEPILLDEWQAVPEVLGAVKRAVDREWSPNRFLLAGSVRARSTSPTWAGTGRVVTVPLFGLSMAERCATIDSPPFLDRLRHGEPRALGHDSLSIVDYVDLALTGTMPRGVFAGNEQTRGRYLSSYLDDIIERDVLEIEPLRDSGRVRRYLEAWAGLSGSVNPDQTVNELAGVRRSTGAAYERLLADLFLIERLPAWHTNRLERLTSLPKRVFIDSGLMAAALGVDRTAVLRDGNLLGRLLETFVIGELRAELAVAEGSPRLYHLREEGGRHEVDVIVEYAGGEVAALEIKATAAPTAADAKHLYWLRERLGDRVVAAALLHTGPARFSLGNGVDAIPIREIWA
jgi:predicted AAA+ superfamily ATPase